MGSCEFALRDDLPCRCHDPLRLTGGQRKIAAVPIRFVVAHAVFEKGPCHPRTRMARI